MTLERESIGEGRFRTITFTQELPLPLPVPVLLGTYGTILDSTTDTRTHPQDGQVGHKFQKWFDMPGITIPGSHRTIVARHPPWALWGTFYRYSSDSEWNRRSTAMFIPEYTHYDPSIPILIFLSLFQKLTTCFGPPQGGENSTGCHPGECQIHHDPVMNCDDVSYQCSFRHSAPIQPTTLLP